MGELIMRINQNIAALNTYSRLSSANRMQAKSLEKLSSGSRINRAADDAAGLSISEKMRGQIRGLEQAQRNAQDGISLIQTAEGALNETHAILQRMRELSVQASSETLDSNDRTAISSEISELEKEIDNIGSSTQFNKINLLNGGLGSSVGSVGSDLGVDDGIANIVSNGAATGTYTVSYVQSTDVLTVQNSAATVVQSVDLTGTFPTGFDTKDISFGDLGVTVTINANLDTTASISANNTFAVSGGNVDIQIGANNESISFSVGDMRAAALSVNSLDVSDFTAAQATVKPVNTAI